MNKLKRKKLRKSLSKNKKRWLRLKCQSPIKKNKSLIFKLNKERMSKSKKSKKIKSYHSNVEMLCVSKGS